MPPDRTSPELNGLKSSFLTSTSYAAIRTYGDARSTLNALPRIKTPTFVFQGRRDFAFGLEQGLAAYRKLGGPKRLYIGDFGHAPSTFPGPDASVVFAEASAWFERFLQNKRNGIDTRKPVELAPDPYVKGKNVSFGEPSAHDDLRTATVASGKTFGSRGKVVLSFKLPKKKLEVFGAPVVTVKASTRSQAKQLTAVVEAVAPGGAATIVSEGGTLLPTRGKAWTVSFPLISDTALIARGSKLRVTLSWTTTAQNPLNLLYLTGVPDGSSLTIKSARITLPLLKTGISV